MYFVVEKTKNSYIYL